MPDPFDLDAARRTLEEVPAPELWDDARRRATEPTVLSLGRADAQPRRRGLALAAAAAVVLTLGTAALLARDGEQPLVTSPVTQPTDSPPPSRSIVTGPGCTFGVSGDPIVLVPGPADPPLFDTSGQPDGQTVVHLTTGTQRVEVHVPGLVVIDLLGERVEQLDLRRGTVDLWFGTNFVQVRWFTGSIQPCSSFTVTAAGGTEDDNRHAAVALADRILLPDELGGEGTADVVAGAWQLERSTVAGVATDGQGLAFDFVDGAATWTDGCSSFGGSYAPGGAPFHLSEVQSTLVDCPLNPIAQAVSTVMGAEQIDVTTEGDRLVLTANDARLTLRPQLDPQTTTSIGPVGAPEPTAP